MTQDNPLPAAAPDKPLPPAASHIIRGLLADPPTLPGYAFRVVFGRPQPSYVQDYDTMAGAIEGAAHLSRCNDTVYAIVDLSNLTKPENPLAVAALCPGSADMLAALKACRDALGNWVEIADEEDQRKRDWDALDMADAAIAAAEGRPAPQPLERPAFVDDDEGETLYLNHYRCDHEGRAAEGQEPAEWSDEWDCMCNDKCPVCNAEVEPHESEEVNDECE